jgi:hypothetical protein
MKWLYKNIREKSIILIYAIILELVIGRQTRFMVEIGTIQSRNLPPHRLIGF